MAPNEQRETWGNWIEGPIKDSVLTLFHRRQIWRGIARLIHEREAPLRDLALWQYHLDLYAATQAVAIRRQADKRRDVISLARLLTEVKALPGIITLDWWVSLWDNEPDKQFPRRIWAEKYGGAELDTDYSEEALNRLLHASGEVKRYVDENLAHLKNPDKGTPAETSILTMDGLDYAIDTVGELFKSCYHLLTAGRLRPPRAGHAARLARALPNDLD